jgi:hypothetical protein
MSGQTGVPVEEAAIAVIAVRGGASAEEVAAVLAALSHRQGDQQHVEGYAAWRASRLRALRRYPE